MIREEKLSGDPERTGKSLQLKPSMKIVKNGKRGVWVAQWGKKKEKQ